MTRISLKRHSVRDILTEHASLYPLMMPCDAVKLIYQSVFGPGHLISDPHAVAEYLEHEMSSLTAVHFSLTEEIGGGFSRIYLSDIAGLTHEESLRLIGCMFLCSADTIHGSAELFTEKLEILRELTDKGEMPFTSHELNQYLMEYMKNGIRPVSHSEQYRNAYCPAYRVVKSEFAALLPIISELVRNGHGIIAIDGFCASGKSTIGSCLAALLEANLIHMDDFFLPPEKRTAERFAEPGGNIDYERFKAEVVDNLPEEKIEYGIFDCSEMKIASEIVLPKRNYTIIEGSYALHPYFGDFADVEIFVETSYDEQIRRIRDRNGAEYLSMFTERWIPFEQRYESAFAVRQRADYVIET